MNYFDLRHMTRDNLIETLNRLSKSYVPNWRFNPGEPDVGSALMLIFADMYSDVIQKSQLIPSKHHIEFLNLLDPIQKSSKGASGYVAFSLSEGTTSSVFVTKGKQLIGLGDAGDNLVFESVEDVCLTPSKLEALYAVHSESDCIMNLYNGLQDPVQKPFYFMVPDVEQNLQKHYLTLSHENLLNLKTAHSVDVLLKDHQNQVRLQNALTFLSQTEFARWQYQREGKWIEFDTVEKLDDGIRLSNDEGVLLESPMIRVQLVTSNAIVTDGLWIRPMAAVTQADALYSNDLRMPDKDGYAFGTQFYAYDAFYIGSDEVLTKPGGLVTLSMDFVIDPVETPFDMPPPQVKWKSVIKKMELEEVPKKKIIITDVTMEYWNGIGWSRLETLDFEANLFSVEPGEMHHARIQFICPEDLQKTTIGASENAWIRFKVLKVDNNYALLGHFHAPKIKSLNLTYSYAKGLSPEIAIRDEFLKTYELSMKESPIQLFNEYGELSGCGLYFSFSEPLRSGPLKLLFSIGTVVSEKAANFQWQMLKYQAGRWRWIDLEVIDGTYNLTETGLLTFIGDDDHAKATLFDSTGYWIRALEMSPGRLPVKINSVYVNAVKVVQKETLVSRYFDLKRHEYSKCMILDHQQLESIEVWVNESYLTDADLKSQKLTYEKQMTVDGNVEAIWVKWQAYEDFSTMTADTRGYVANAFEGTLTFGDSIRGYLPDGHEDKNVRVNYEINLGVLGNVKPMAVQRLAESIPNVNKVFNPIDFYGGKAPESRQDTLKRVSDSFRHRERAKSVGDFDALIQAADYDIAEVVTLSNRDDAGNVVMGSVTSAIRPKRMTYDQDYFRGLKQRIYKHMSTKLPCTLVPEKTFFVVEPLPVRVEVHFKGSIDSMEVYVEVYKAIEEHLVKYLDPMSGNQNGRGWHIGELPTEQYLLSVIQGIKGLRSVELLVINAVIPDGYSYKEISFKQLKRNPFTIVRGGSHAINLTL